MGFKKRHQSITNLFRSVESRWVLINSDAWTHFTRELLNRDHYGCLYSSLRNSNPDMGEYWRLTLKSIPPAICCKSAMRPEVGSGESRIRSGWVLNQTQWLWFSPENQNKGVCLFTTFLLRFSKRATLLLCRMYTLILVLYPSCYIFLHALVCQNLPLLVYLHL